MQKLVFFDCECANTKGGIGKICSLGYVVSDENFNVLEKDDIVMNPECEFDWYLFSGKGGCSLAYTKEYFRSQPSFPEFYDKLVKIFSDENPMVFGFAVANDVGFVNTACHRYKKEYINYLAMDLAKIFQQEYHETKKLSEWTQFFGYNDEALTAHKSVDDAMMTLLCLKAFCQRKKISVQDLWEHNKGNLTSTKVCLQQAEERQKRKKAEEKIKRLYDRKNYHCSYTTVEEQHFEFDKSLMKNPDLCVKLAQKIYNNGGILHRHLKVGSGYVVFAEKLDENDNQKLKARELNGITALELLAILE